MDLLNIPTALRVGNGNGQLAGGSVGEYIADRIKNLSITNYLTQLADVNWIGNTLIRVRYKTLLKATNYGDGTTPHQYVNVIEKDFPINNFRTIKAKFETFDEVAFQNDIGYQAWAIGMISDSIELDRAGLFLKKYWEQIGSKAENQIVIPTFADETLTGQSGEQTAKTDSKVWSIENIKLQKIYNNIIQGTEENAILTLLDPISEINRVFGNTTGSTGDKAFKAIQEGKLEPSISWGQRYLVNTLLNNIIPKNICMAEDYDLDTSNMPAITLYRGACAMPFKLFSMISTIDPIDGNAVVIVKYKTDFIPIYPQLCKAIVKTATKTPINPNWVFIQGGDIETNTTDAITRQVVINPDKADQEAFNVASSNTSVATVVKNGSQITITPVANGTSTITITSTVDNTKTYSIVVKKV